MSDQLRAVHAEVLKLKRTLALRLAVCGPLIVVVLVFGMYAYRGMQMSGPNPIIGFAQLTLTIWTIIMFPLYAALAAALLAAIEHQTESWRHLLALPLDRKSVFIAKWIVGAGLLLLSAVVLAAGVSIAAGLLRLLKPAWSSSGLPVAMIFRGSLLSFCAAGLLLSIQMWVSLRWRNFLPGIVIAVLALVVMFIAIPRGVGLFASFFPWSLPAMAMAPHNTHRTVAVVVGLLGGAIVGAAACWDLSRREFC